ncbi:MAG: zinc ABC transporter solute-binding protein [Candidatus Omnitrophica bacterium]|nr:zinc ABC transporter solute-binding protein [Candidatus Omnitrophota bacterium]
MATFLVVPADTAEHKLQVVATIFPLYDFARTIAGDKADVSMLVPPGVEVHSFEPKPHDMSRINRADIFLFTGRMMEPWAADLLKGVTNNNLSVVDVGHGIHLIEESGNGEKNGQVGEAVPGTRFRTHQDGQDPHIWLDPVLAQKMIDTIASALASADSANRGYYVVNAENYKAKLRALDVSYTAGLSSCELRTIIYAGHFAFGYLAERYRLDHVSPYKGFSPDAEPSPREIAEVIRTVRRTGASVIYYEELLEPRLARIIAGETGAKLRMLNGAHNVSRDEMISSSYLSIMESNLAKLKEGLRCK